MRRASSFEKLPRRLLGSIIHAAFTKSVQYKNVGVNIRYIPYYILKVI